MLAIDIPESYWTPERPGFAELVSPYHEAFRGIAADVALSAAPLVGYGSDDVRRDLVDVDGNQTPVIDGLVTEHQAIDTTPTRDVLTRYGHGDSLTGRADSIVPPDTEIFWDPVPPPGGFPNFPPGPGPGVPDDTIWPTAQPAPRVVADTAPPPPAAPAPTVSIAPPPDRPVIMVEGEPPAPIEPAVDVSAPSISTEPVARLAEIAPDDVPITRRELLEALGKLSPTITLLV